MQWTDRIRQVKIFLVVAAILIAVASLLVSHSLTHDLSDQERSKMQVWAEAMKSLSADGGLGVAEFDAQAQARELGDAVQPFGAIQRVETGVADGLVAVG